MWYVIQTISGKEPDVKSFLEASLDATSYRKCLIPIYEEVRHRRGSSRILFRKLFPGYLFIDIDKDNAVLVNQVLKKIPRFTRILNVKDNEGMKLFTPIEPHEQQFLEALLEDGILHVSYIETEKNSRKIKRIIGPLGRYRNNIVSFSTSSREAKVDIMMFGVRHRISFGLWNKDDARLPMFEGLIEKPEDPVMYGGEAADVGIYPGDTVEGCGDPYEGCTFIVDKVNPIQRTIETKMELLGDMRNITVYIDQVRKVEPQEADQTPKHGALPAS